MEIYPVGSSILPYIKHPHDHDFVVIGTTEEIDELRRQHPENGYFGHFSERIMPWSYQCHFWPPEMQSVDILGKDKDKYIAVLKRCRILPYDKKSLYHYLTGYYMILNNSYELTEEQITNINIAHDMADWSAWEQLRELTLKGIARL